MYVGTENGLYVSFDDGDSWQPLQANLPHAPVYWLVVQEHFNDLVVATYGRGFWILDDLTPIQQMTDAIRDASAHLFPPRPTYRFRQGTEPVTMQDDPAAGQNPPYGVAINYFLKSTPDSEVRIRIEDSNGKVIRNLTGTKTAGLNRVTWNLTGEPSKEVRMRTSPAYAPEIRVGPDGTRPAFGAPRMSVLVPPGNYVAKLVLGSQELSQPIVIKKDPNSGGTERDIDAQTAILLELQKDLSTGSEMVNQIELIRSQLYQLTSLLDSGSAPVKTAADDLDKKLIEIEENLIQRKLTGQGQDTVRYPPQLLSKINYLANGLSGSDFGPTSQQREVQTLLKQQLTALQKRFDDVLKVDVSAFNKMLRDRNIGNVITQGH